MIFIYLYTVLYKLLYEGVEYVSRTTPSVRITCKGKCKNVGMVLMAMSCSPPSGQAERNLHPNALSFSLIHLCSQRRFLPVVNAPYKCPHRFSRPHYESQSNQVNNPDSPLSSSILSLPILPYLSDGSDKYHQPY